MATFPTSLWLAQQLGCSVCDGGWGWGVGSNARAAACFVGKRSPFSRHNPPHELSSAATFSPFGWWDAAPGVTLLYSTSSAACSSVRLRLTSAPCVHSKFKPIQTAPERFRGAGLVQVYASLANAVTVDQPVVLIPSGSQLYEVALTLSNGGRRSVKYKVQHTPAAGVLLTTAW